MLNEQPFYLLRQIQKKEVSQSLMLPPMVSQRILTYFVRGSISCFDYVYSTTDLLVQPNPNQSNRRSAVQLYFHLQSK